jgi:hypothetical protein
MLRKVTDHFVQRRDDYDRHLKEGLRADHHDLPHFTFDRCSVGHTIGGDFKWKNNGKTLVQEICEFTECEGIAASKDGKVTRLIARTGGKPGLNCWEQVVWEDGGHDDKPPEKPPEYQPEPWDNKCPVLQNPAGVMQSSDYGWRTINGQTDFHGGIDIAVGAGTEILSISTAYIVKIISNGAKGETGVIVRENDRLVTYWHIIPHADLKENSIVLPGQLMGTVSPHTPAIHFHFATHQPPDLNWELRSDANSKYPSCP